MVCRQRLEDTELHRAGRLSKGVWYLGRGSGRGLWWCREGECAERVNQVHVARSLRCSPAEIDVVALREVAKRSKMVVVVEE
ncbi:MAG: DUF448 domain-containing protein [Acidimicrobiaceae bacterium]|nr:DUF448 domain-containing protein [Acidimicrobiaceae bacterium]